MASETYSSNPSTVHKIRVDWHKTPTLGIHRRYTHYTSEAAYTAVAHQYPSIRYVQPLTPADRWRRAKPLSGISLPLPFKKTPACPQPGLRGSKKKLSNEDCLLSDIWVPADLSDQERERRPVLIFLHGGFLQWGAVSQVNWAEFVRRTGAVVVVPAYRLNALGFLSCEGMYEDGGFAGNFGFWDQRLAIEWVARNIHAWGGDADRITLAGYSAGSYSTFQQLMYESRLSDEQALIKQVWMLSNGCGLQPKALGETKEHFERFADVLGIPAHLSETEKLELLREVPMEKIIQAVANTPVNAYRAVTDGAWADKTFMQDIVTGALGKTLARRRVRVMIGENKEENNYYAQIGPPNDYIGLIKRLAVEFPAVNATRLASLYAPGGKLPKQYKNWQDIFGDVYADCQIHLTGRGFLNGIKDHVDPANVFRYRIYRRVKAADALTPPDLGVTHTSDMFIWFVGSGKQIQPEEKATVNAWVRPVKDFLAGERVDWGCTGAKDLRIIREETWGIATEPDPLWAHYMHIWKRLLGGRSSKL